MPRKSSLAALLLSSLAGLAVAQSRPTDRPAERPADREVAPMPSLAPMIKRVSPAVVSIGIRGAVREQQRNPLLEDPFFRRFFNVPPDAGTRERPFQSAGSGVIVDAPRGYIITNAHVVEHAREITVTLFDEREFAAKLVGSDPRTDIAVIQIEAPGLTQISLGDLDRLEPGDYVAAIGNPFGLQHSVSYGIVSALGRSGMNPAGFESLIQTDASINPGNSGGALVNLRGELIGINNMILSGSGGNIGIGFAIPANMAQSVMDQLIRYGAVKRGQIGVTLAPVTADIAQALGLAAPNGALVTQVARESAAARAGLRASDVVTAVNGKAVKSVAEFRNVIGLMRVGDRAEIALLREGKPVKVSAVVTDPAVNGVATQPAPGAVGAAPAGTLHRGLDGAQLEDQPDGGVAVRGITAGTSAAGAGLRAGDVIIAANGARIVRRADLVTASAAAAARGGTLVLQVRRNGEITIVLLR
ncbi:MAG: Do family serine endopeptidase [Gammaproteobacteria bacterium]